MVPDSVLTGSRPAPQRFHTGSPQRFWGGDLIFVNFCVCVFWLFFTDAYTKIHVDFTSSSCYGEGIYYIGYIILIYTCNINLYKQHFIVVMFK